MTTFPPTFLNKEGRANQESLPFGLAYLPTCPTGWLALPTCPSGWTACAPTVRADLPADFLCRIAKRK